MKRKIIFHIGLEKTGTDSFQRFCKNNSPLFRHSSVLYPTQSLAFSKYNHEPLVACYLPYTPFGISTSGQQRVSVLRSLMAEINHDSADTILISAEHFSSRFSEIEIRQLASDFADYDCRVAVVVRDHLSRMYSSYCQSVLSGSHMTVDEFCDVNFHPDCRYTRYKETILLWEHVFGKENISVFCYRSGRSIIPDLCKTLVSSSIPLGAVASYWDNKSIGLGPTETLRLVNKAMARLPGASTNYATWLLLRHARRGIGKLLAVVAGYRPTAPRLMTRRNQCRLKEIAEVDCDWLEKHYGVRLPDHLTGQGRPGDPAESKLDLSDIDMSELGAPRPPKAGDGPSPP
jgi:Sulfotransferase domain